MAHQQSAPIAVDLGMLSDSEDTTYDSTGYHTPCQSLASSICEYIFENGEELRRRCTAGGGDRLG